MTAGQMTTEGFERLAEIRGKLSLSLFVEVGEVEQDLGFVLDLYDRRATECEARIMELEQMVDEQGLEIKRLERQMRARS